jgi:tetratricopeptide (TPR) repeat protein
MAVCAIAGMPTAGHAALSGQKPPPAVAAARISAESQNILKGEIATGRPNLFLAVQSVAASDFTDLVARVIGDDTTYDGLVSTLEDAISSAPDDPKRQAEIYNLARLHLLRSELIRPGYDRGPALAAAAEAADRFSTAITDPAAWELKGDVAAERGDVPGALAAYKRMVESGAPAALAQYKTGWTYERASRIPLAESAYRAAALAQSTAGTGGPQLRHLIYQGLARTALAQGNDPAALAALAKSARAGQDEGAPYHFKMDVAARLLQRGYAREVLAYATAALAASPDDPDALAIRDRARVAARGR